MWGYFTATRCINLLLTYLLIYLLTICLYLLAVYSKFDGWLLSLSWWAHQATAYMEGQKCPERRGIPPDSGSGGICFSLMVDDSHCTDYGHHSRVAVVAPSWRIVERCQTIGWWQTLLNDDVNGCRHNVKLQSVLQLCSGCVGCLALKEHLSVVKIQWSDKVNHAATMPTWWSGNIGWLHFLA